MEKHLFVQNYNREFSGRERELRWLDENLFGFNSFNPIFVTGLGGVGKTALVKHWLSSRKITSTSSLQVIDSLTTLWVDANDDFNEILDQFIKELYGNRVRSEFIVVFDNTDNWTQKEFSEASNRIFNYKAVRSLIFITRNEVELKRSKTLNLKAMSESEANDLIKVLIPEIDNPDSILDLMDASKGFPLAIKLLKDIIKKQNLDSVKDLLSRPIYNLENEIIIPKSEVITNIAPVIIHQNNRLIKNLQKYPKELYSLTPRDFEKLLADLLDDMGWDVELTKQTRDGGADILAYLNTEVGRFLCLVEAKRYREDRKIGVDLVRTLYGTLCDAQANSAMLVTTSSFSSIAKEFQKRHEYQLSLKDYTDIVKWIMKFGNNKKHD